MQNLKLIKTKTVKGYLLDNIKDVLGPIKYKKFVDWIYGQTVGVYKGKSLIYEYDFDRFLKGLPVLD